jgi:hypothetical protein
MGPLPKVWYARYAPSAALANRTSGRSIAGILRWWSFGHNSAVG